MDESMLLLLLLLLLPLLGQHGATACRNRRCRGDPGCRWRRPRDGPLRCRPVRRLCGGDCETFEDDVSDNEQRPCFAHPVHAISPSLPPA